MDELVNFRDLGGMVGFGGKKIRLNRLLRSAALITPIQIGYDLKQVVDLRSEDEVNKNPDIVPKGAKYIHAKIKMDGSVKGKKIGGIVFCGRIASCNTYLLKVYTGFVTSEAARSGFAILIKACLNNLTGATLFHCVAGKDRTGFAAAILLKILGVSDTDIMTDYMKTEEARREVNKMFIARYKRRGLIFKRQQEALAVIMGVRPEYLQAAFNEMDNAYGGFNEYLAQGLGVTPQDVLRLRELYLEA